MFTVAWPMLRAHVPAQTKVRTSPACQTTIATASGRIDRRAPILHAIGPVLRTSADEMQTEVGSFEARRRMRAPTGDFAVWLRTAWWKVVGSELSAHHGRGVDIATAFFSEQAEQDANRARIAEYFWRESGKWAQKRAPEGFGSLKFYGRWGQKQGFNPVSTAETVSEAAGYELRRVLRRMARGKQQAIAARYGKKVRREVTPRGRDGLTVFDVSEADVLGPRLIAWAEAEAARKAEEAKGKPEPILWYRGPQTLRALSEFELSPDDEWYEDRREPEGYEPVDPWDLLSPAEQESIERAEIVYEQEMERDAREKAVAERRWREERKAVLRQRDRERRARRAERDGRGERGNTPPPPRPGPL